MFPPLSPTQRIYPDHRDIRIGVVIGTFAAVPYVHLGLESLRRLAPDVPVLVHDDGSRQADGLEQLCNGYGAKFWSNQEQMGHEKGDLSAFFRGLKWAGLGGLDILVKFSRRWIPTMPWVADLQKLALESQAHTFSGYCEGFGFRTECVAMHVPTWVQGGSLDLLRPCDTHGMLVEGFIDMLAGRLPKCDAFEEHAAGQVLPDQHNNYTLWSLIGTSRVARPDGAIWHTSCPVSDYLACAARWGLNYALRDFEGLHSHSNR